MATLTTTDLHFVASRVPRDVAEVVKKNGLFIGGGFIRDTVCAARVSDIDLFGRTKEGLRAAGKDLALNRKGRFLETDNAFTVLAPPRLSVQFIHRWLYESAGDVAASFDFTICQAVLWYSEETWHSEVSDRFYPDLAARRLYYTAPDRNEDAGGSLMRVRKFLAKGYTIQAPSMARVVARLVKGVDFEKRDQWDEPWLATVLTGLLREVDPLVVVDGIDLVDEHELETKEATNA